MTFTEERQDTDAAALAKLKDLGVDVAGLRTSEGWQAWLKVAKKFHRYSFFNQLLITTQCPHASHVAGYRKWNELGRQVRKGEKGLKIFAPMTRKDEETQTTKLVGFRLASVFDISQTDGDPLPDQPVWPITESGPEGLWDHLQQNLPDDVTLEIRDDSLRGERGYLQREAKRIVIVRAEEPSMCATLLHELSHWFDAELEANPAIYAHTRADCEVVAESAAWLVAQQVGLDVHSEAVHYLASWHGDDSALLRLGQRTIKTSQRLSELVKWEREETHA